GTVVVSYYDARYDAAQARVTTMLTASIDGGNTFSKSVFANLTRNALDAVTLKNVVLEPVPDNQGSGNAGRDATFGFGDPQGLAVNAGLVYPVWSSNQNSGALDIRTVRHTLPSGASAGGATIAAGPRIVSSDMGPVDHNFTAPVTTQFFPYNNTFDPATGIRQLDGFTLTFDRPVDPGTFDNTKVQVFYRGTAPGSSPTPVAVATVTALDRGRFGPAGADGATVFFVRFTTPQTATGTYSYAVGPDI